MAMGSSFRPVGGPVRRIEGGPEPFRPVGPARPVFGGPPEDRGPEPVAPGVGENSPILGSFKKGGTVPKTGKYELHEGEEVKPKEEEHSPEERHSFHRAMSHLRQGALHRHFGIAEDQPIPRAKKQEAANSENPHVAKMGQMALNMEKWHKGKKK